MEQDMERHAPGIVYFGMAGAFSRPPLEALLDAGVAVRAVALPALAGAGTFAGSDDAPYTVLPLYAAPAAIRRALPLMAQASDEHILHRAAARGIPALELRRLDDPRTVAALAGFAPDVICVACFSRKIPTALLRLPRLGCLNVHPSLLPVNRGPDPLFWTFHTGESDTGVTIHVMDEGLDSGPIVLQRALPVPEGITEAELEQSCATTGGALLVEAIRGLAEGRLAPQPQDERLATYHSWPSEDDYTVSSDWSARRAYRFACGIAGRAQPIRIVTPGATFRLIELLGYDADATLDAPFHLAGGELALQCTPGVFYARVASSGD